MDRSPYPIKNEPKQPNTPVMLAAWPKCAQCVTAFLLFVAAALLTIHAYACSRWSTRPTDLLHETYRVDLNSAETSELLQLPGVGESLARKIEAYRAEHGRFHQVEELLAVSGVGPATLERLQDWIYVAESSNQAGTASSASSAEILSRKKTTRKDQLSKKPAPTKAVDINQATAAELQQLPGVGLKMAERIVAERRNRPFKSVDELRRVSGIGPKKLETLRPHVIVGSDSIRLATRE